MNKKWLLTMISIIGLLLFVACSSSTDSDESTGSSNGESNSDSGETINLRMAWWGGQERHDRTLKVIDMYEELNPHVKITAEYSGMDGYFDKLSTQFAAGNAPDIIQYGGNLNDFVNRGVVLPLDDYVGNELDISKHDQSMIDAGTFDGTFYGVTLGTNAASVLINKTLFEEANIPLPDENWTWDDLNEIAANISESVDGVYGVADFEEDGFGVYLAQHDKFTYLDGEFGFDESDFKNYLQLWQSMRDNDGAVPPEIQVAASQTPEQSLIVQRSVAMQMITSNQFGAYTNASEDEFVLHIHPYNEQGQNGVALRPSQFLAGTNTTEHPEEVAKFLDFFVNHLEATELLGNDRGAPVNSEVREHLMSASDELDEAIYAYIALVSETSDAPYIPNLPGYNENTNLYKETTERVAFGQATVDEAAQSYYEELQANVERYSDSDTE
ncbi:ABC transporter substrate-binding protein [Bacillus sp. TS-2]|nr:ABC transporter substrate-binding protein [Bacillus sp. TS-2]